MKKLVFLLISLTMILMFSGCSEEKMLLSRLALDENGMKEEAITPTIQGESENFYPEPQEQAYYNCKADEEHQYCFSFWRLEEGKWMESKLNEGKIEPRDNKFTVYLSSDEEGYGAGVEIQGDLRTVYYHNSDTPMDAVYLNESKKFSGNDRMILAVGGEKASNLKPEIITDMEKLKNLQDGLYLLTVTLS